MNSLSFQHGNDAFLNLKLVVSMLETKCFFK